MSENDLTMSGVLQDLLSGGRKEKEGLLYSIKKALRLNKMIQEDNTIIVPSSKNSVIIKQDGDYVKAVLTEDKSNANLKDSTEEEFKKADLELRLYNILSRISFFKNSSNPCIFEEDQVNGDVPYCPNDLYLAKFYGLKNEIKSGEEDDALLHVLQFYESLCSNLFQSIVDIAGYLLGDQFNAYESLEDCLSVTDEIMTQIKDKYNGVPDTLSHFLGNDGDKFDNAIRKVLSDLLPGFIENLRKELNV